VFYTTVIAFINPNKTYLLIFYYSFVSSLALIQALEQKTSIQILLYLLSTKDQKDNVTAIFRSGAIKGGQTAMYTALDKLQTAGLIASHQWAERTLRLISLTPKGEKIAQQIERIISNHRK